jgi:hypothetical protein
MSLVDFVGNQSVEAGSETAGVQTRLIAVQTFTINATSSNFSLPINFQVTTGFPAAWVSFFTGANHTLFPSGASCSGSKQNCIAPPLGMYVNVIAPLVFERLTLTIATVSLAIV